MDILLVHNNFPGQFRHLAKRLGEEKDHRVISIGSQVAPGIEGVPIERYAAPTPFEALAHPFARNFDFACRRAEQVLYACSALSAQGYNPGVILSHSGWGESLPLREAFPRARIINYSEYYYRPDEQDVNFDPEFSFIGTDARIALQMRNATQLLSLVEGDAGLTPTAWQRSTFPLELQPKIKILHEGIDTSLFRPNMQASFRLPSSKVLTGGDEVVTYVARNLEPIRGFHVFMRALPALLELRPSVEVVIVGGTDVSYGAAPPDGYTWKDIFYGEVVDRVDQGRIHFTGTLPLSEYAKVLQVSKAHAYMTYPFITSWSLIEAMSSGCVVVCSQTGPVEEIVDGHNGLLTPFFDAESLAYKLANVLENPEEYEAMRSRARNTALERFEVETCTAQIRNFLLEGD